MAVLEPLYREFRKRSEKLFSSFSDEEIQIIENYFSSAIEIMNDTTKKLNNK
jgi:hypothetical protein